MRDCPVLIVRPLRAAMIAATALLVTAAAAEAAPPPCAPTQAAPVALGGIGTAIEGAVVDRQGRLYVTDLFNGRVLRFDQPGAAATVIARLPGGGGGALALEPDGTVIVGSGADARVFLGDVLKPGIVWRLNPSTGALTQIARGFSAADGLAVTADDTIYATNDFGSLVGRRLPNGTVQSAWARFPSANGAVLSSDDQYLYVSRTFVNPGVSRIPIARPNQPENLLNFSGFNVADAPDGLTLDSHDRPIVPTDVGGDILRIDAPGKLCRLAGGLPNSSVIVYGRGPVGFAAGHLYRAGFDGRIYEIPSAYDPDASLDPAA